MSWSPWTLICSHGYSATARIACAISSMLIVSLGGDRWLSRSASVTVGLIAFAAEASPSVFPVQLKPPPQVTMSASGLTAVSGTTPRWVTRRSIEPAAIEPAAIDPAAIEPAAIEPEAIEPEAIEPAAIEPRLPEMARPNNVFDVSTPTVLPPKAEIASVQFA